MRPVAWSGYGYLSTDLAELLEQPGLDCETRTKYLNLLKMSTYLLCQLAEAFEDLAQQPTDPMVTGKVRTLAEDESRQNHAHEDNGVNDEVFVFVSEPNVKVFDTLRFIYGVTF